MPSSTVVTVDLSPRMNIDLKVKRVARDTTEVEGFGCLVGQVEIIHPSYAERFQLFVTGRDIQHTWYRYTPNAKRNRRTPASITEGHLLWSIFNGEQS